MAIPDADGNGNGGIRAAANNLHRLLKHMSKTKQRMRIPRGIYLAPMVRGSELAFRTLARLRGDAALCYSPMLRDRDVLSVASDSDPYRFAAAREGELRIDAAGRTDPAEEAAYLMLRDTNRADCANLVVQLCGSDPGTLGRATAAALDAYSRNVGTFPAGIDLNLGCPQECASRENFGAFLDPGAAISCVASMRKAVDDASGANCESGKIPTVSAKIRLLESGVDDTVDYVRKLQAAGVDFVTVHCRRRTDKHDGRPDWDAGSEIVAALSSSRLPIVLNGGISNRRDAEAALERTGCHAVMAATGYLRNHRRYESSPEPSTFDPQHAALEYLDAAERHPPPSYLYIQKHLRWIFRDALRPEDDPGFDGSDYSDWRVRLWTFLVRPYLRSVDQFRMFVALYVRLSGGDGRELPQSIRSLVDEVTFGSVKKAGKVIGRGTQFMELH